MKTISITDDIFSKEINLEKFMARQPELVGIVVGIKFYEHPLYGDEVALIAIRGNQCGYSHWQEIPSLDELLN